MLKKYVDRNLQATVYEFPNKEVGKKSIIKQKLVHHAQVSGKHWQSLGITYTHLLGATFIWISLTFYSALFICTISATMLIREYPLIYTLHLGR